MLTRRTLLGRAGRRATTALWRTRQRARRRASSSAQHEDGSWDVPCRDYQKYGGSLWQVVFLGELWADGDDERVQRAADYAFSRQLPDGSWSCNAARPATAIPCLTANVGRGARPARAARATSAWSRALALLVGRLRAARVPRLLGSATRTASTATATCSRRRCCSSSPRCRATRGPTARRRCATPRGGAARQGGLPLPAGGVTRVPGPGLAAPSAQSGARRASASWPSTRRCTTATSPGWLRFGFPLSYNSDALEALAALAGVGETRRPEYEPALEVGRARRRTARCAGRCARASTAR